MYCPVPLLIGLMGAFQAAVVIDRIAVIVGKHAIKLSDIDRDLRLTEFLNDEKPNLSPESRRKAAERLIDQTIIHDEMTSAGYSRPTQSDAEALLERIRKERFGGSEARLGEALARYGLTEDQLRAQLVWQLSTLRFINERFRAGALVTDQDVRSWYDGHLAELKREYPKNNSFDALEPKIRASLEGERTNQNFTQWLDQARKQQRIEYRQEAFQ